jgi:hypothetical protein
MNEDEWFEISKDMWRDPGEIPAKFGFPADANVPPTPDFYYHPRSGKSATLVAPRREARRAFASGRDVPRHTDEDNLLGSFRQQERP